MTRRRTAAAAPPSGVSDCDPRVRAAVDAAVSRERVDLAGEVHDLVGAGLSVIVAQAAAARSRSPEDAAATLADIEQVGRRALVELRQLVGRWHAEPAQCRRPPDGTDPAAVPPLPDLRDLPDLLARVQAAGLPVELAVRGRRRRVPPEVGAAAYRVVQEALTNTLRHAGPARARVVLALRRTRLEVQVEDDGAGPPAGTLSVERPAPGYGLAGMRRRVERLGGRLVAGPGTRRGFRVHARLPLAPLPRLLRRRDVA